MLVDIRILQNESNLWSYLGFLSTIVGLVCFALSSSFKHLFGEWNHLKLLLYIITSLITCSIVLLAKKIQLSKSFMVKSHVGFLVLMLTSVYSYFYDKSMNGKPDILSIVSYAAFAFMSLCFSRKMELGFEVGLFNFFLGCLTVQLMKISLILAFVAAIFCYSLIIFRCYSDSQLEIEAANIEDHVAIKVDSANGEISSTLTQQSPSIGEFSRESTSRDNQQNSKEDDSLSFQQIFLTQTQPSPRFGEFSWESISGDNQQNREDYNNLFFQQNIQETEVDTIRSPSVYEFSWESISEFNPQNVEDNSSLYFQNEPTMIDSFSGEIIFGENHQQISEEEKNLSTVQFETAREGSVSGKIISEENHEQISEEEKSLSIVQVETTNQDNVTSENIAATVEKQSSTIGIEPAPHHPPLKIRS